MALYKHYFQTYTSSAGPLTQITIIRFKNNMVPIQGVIYFSVLFNTFLKEHSQNVKFYVIIQEKSIFTKLTTITSTPQRKYQFPTLYGVEEVKRR